MNRTRTKSCEVAFTWRETEVSVLYPPPDSWAGWFDAENPDRAAWFRSGTVGELRETNPVLDVVTKSGFACLGREAAEAVLRDLPPKLVKKIQTPKEGPCPTRKK